jgi:predicted S18 family serine protease
MIKTLKNKSKGKKKDKLTKAKSSLKKKQKIKLPKYIVAIKVLIIVALVLSFYHVKQSSSNTISLLAVSEDQFGEVTTGSIIKLHLTTKPGSGKINVNLNTIQEIDTQISIINSQKIACELFSLDCESYDFFYDFEGSALVLKGPSASSAIAVLVAKTLNKEKLDNNTVITGSFEFNRN